MRTLVCISAAIALIGCGNSNSPTGNDAGNDTSQADAPSAPETNRDDTNPAVRKDAGQIDAPSAPETNRDDSNPPIGDDAGNDTGQADAPSAEETNRDDTNPAVADGAGYDVGQVDAHVVLDTNQNDLPGNPADAADGVSAIEAGEQCTCAEGSGVSPVSWSCFCSVESCTRTLSDFVGAGDGGKAVKIGQGTVLVMEYANCNLVLVQAKTYSDYVPASEYVFDRTTETLLGAKVWLDDRQHSCPFATDGGRWVFGYQSGSYPVPQSCQATECLPGSGACPL
jgi:hypothetical protein